MVVSGCAENFQDSLAVELLLKHECIESRSTLDFLQSVKFHGVPINRESHVLLDHKVYVVTRLIRTDSTHFVLLHEVAPSVLTDELGAYYIEPVCLPESQLPYRLVAMHSACKLTGLWSIVSDSRVYLIPKY